MSLMCHTNNIIVKFYYFFVQNFKNRPIKYMRGLWSLVCSLSDKSSYHEHGYDNSHVWCWKHCSLGNFLGGREGLLKKRINS